MPRLSRFVFAFVLLAALMPQFAQAQAPSITIDTPQQSEIVGAGSVFVAGTGTALFENNVVIQALDYAGIVLGQTAATVDAELGGSGPWSAQLMLRVPPGTPGRIYVFSQSPADGAIIADATVDVMFGEAPPPPTDTPEPPPTDTATPTATPEPPPTDTPEPPPTSTATATATPEPPPTDTPEPPPTHTATATATREPPPVSVEITIRIPIPGEIVSNRQIVVSGTGSGLPENTVVVQALDTRGRVIAQRPTTVEAPLGGFGPWSVTLDYNVPAGTPGMIHAFAQSPADGSIMAEATVPVTFGEYIPPTATFTPAPPTPRPPTATPTRIAPPTPMPLPFIAIDSPRSGDVVSPVEVFVTGSGVALPENNVVVQVLDSSGRIVGQRATTVDAPLGGSGRWSTVVRLNVRSGTAGRIYAFAPSPADGRVLADASVAVRFGAAPPPTPTPTPIAAPAIRIERPVNGAFLDASRPFAISGIGTNLFENNVVVRIRDAFGRTLRQVATTADRNGRWAVTVEVSVPNGSASSIYAFSTSPATGAVVADDLVQVTFIASCQVRTDWPVYVVQPGDTLAGIAQKTGSTVAELVQANCLAEPTVIYVGQALHVPRLPNVTPPATATPALEIIVPEVNDELTPNTGFMVTGEAVGVAPDLVFARLLDSTGAVVAETRTTPSGAGANSAGAPWQWSASLIAANVQRGTVGQVFVYAVSPGDGAIVVSAATPVRFGPDEGRPFIAIDGPLPYSTVPTDTPVVVRGVGRGLFENNVVVQAVDNNGNILITLPVTMQTAEVGGEGQWVAELPIEVVTRGRIVAFSPSPVDGSHMAEAAIDVYFGDPAALASSVMVNYPLPGTIITAGQPFVVAAGNATGVLVDSLQLLVQDTHGEVLALLPMEVDTVTGAWSANLQLDAPIQADREVWMQIIGQTPSGGAPLTDRITVRTQRADAAVTGNVVYRERMALPEGAKVTVQLYNASLADAPPELTVIGQQVIDGAVGSPIPFVVPFASADLMPGAIYAVNARIEDAEGNLLFINTTMTPAITNGSPVADVEVMLQRVP